MNISKICQVIKNSDDFEISTDIYSDSANKSAKRPLIIFCHGFKGFKDWGAFPYMMKKAAESGFAAASFNFSHNGVSKENPMAFTRPDLFAENTFSKELDDLQAVLDYYYNNDTKYNIDKTRIGLIGHSRGGGIAAIKASEDERIKCLALLASISDFDRYTEKQKKNWKEKGYIEVENTRTKQVMRMNYTLVEDIEKKRDRLDIKKAVSNLKKPLLIIHGK